MLQKKDILAQENAVFNFIVENKLKQRVEY